MAFADHLETMRAKPEHVRRRIAFWSSFGVSALIFVFWLGSFSAPGVPASGAQASASGAQTSSQSAMTASVANAKSPLASLIAGAGAFGKDVWELIFGTKKVEYSEVIVAPGK